jgi:hypothetical protein
LANTIAPSTSIVSLIRIASAPATRLKDGKVIADLAGAPVIQSPNGARQILMPTARNGCLTVVVNVTFGK